MLDRTAAGLGHSHDDCGFERAASLEGSLSRLTREACFAGGIGARQVGERLRDRFDLLIGEAELIAGKTGRSSAGAIVTSPSRSRSAAGAP